MRAYENNRNAVRAKKAAAWVSVVLITGAVVVAASTRVISFALRKMMLKSLWKRVRYWIGLAFSDPSVVEKLDHSPSDAPIRIVPR